ncbi:MAG: hypothetical protein WKF31_04170 [Thermoleophilaceae bacterium]
MLFRAGGGVLDYRVPVDEAGSGRRRPCARGSRCSADLHRLRQPRASLVEPVRRTCPSAPGWSSWP